MRNISTWISTLILLLLLTGEIKGQEYSFMSYNIRYDNVYDTNNSWVDRREEVAKLINHFNPDILGIQEGLLHQVQYINKGLHDYDFIGKGRKDGNNLGEFSAIYFDSTKFTVIDQSTFWLSENSDSVSIGWDAELERICTYGLFEDIITKNRIWVFNTHFDHVGILAREKSAELLLAKINELVIVNIPVILMGDLNSAPDSKPIEIINRQLFDASKITIEPFYGPVGTFTGFNTKKVQNKKIDYVFVRNMKVLSYTHIDDRINNDKLISDHLPIFVVAEKISNNNISEGYNSSSIKNTIFTGGAKLIPVSTPNGDFNVWTKRVGNNPTAKVLLLHGGPGANHMYLESFDSYFPNSGIEYIYYDQLGSNYSDQPKDTSLWNVNRFVDEVEQVRVALGLDSSNFFLYGQSWGGILAIEYALKYQSNIKGLIISNMMSSIPDYILYADKVLGPQLDAKVLQEIKELEANDDFTNPRYLELIETNYYPKHVLRMPLEDWPEPVIRSFSRLNNQIYVRMQGPSEFGVAGDAKLKYWDRKSDLCKIKVPTLTIGAVFDTMDPEHMEWMASEVQNGSYLYCPHGSHLTMYDDQEIYFKGMIKFIKDVDRGHFSK